MAKSPDTIETVLFIIELLRRIPRNSKVTARELHEQLRDAGVERDIRTIQRQMEMLSEYFDIERDERSKPYGYRWLDKAHPLAIPNLMPQESLLLLLAEQYLSNILPSKLMKSMSSFFEQARKNLGPESNSKLEREWTSKVRFVASSQPLLPPKIASGVFETVSEALYGNYWLNLDYRNLKGNRSNIEVMPLGLVQQGACLYLVCRYKGYDNERNLALHRILSAKKSTVTFKRPKEFDLKKYDDDGRFGYGEGEKIKLTFRIERNAGFPLLESPLSADQEAVYINDDLIEITATVIDSGMLERWLRGFGDAVSDVRRESLS